MPTSHLEPTATHINDTTEIKIIGDKMIMLTVSKYNKCITN